MSCSILGENAEERGTGEKCRLPEKEETLHALALFVRTYCTLSHFCLKILEIEPSHGCDDCHFAFERLLRVFPFPAFLLGGLRVSFNLGEKWDFFAERKERKLGSRIEKREREQREKKEWERRGRGEKDLEEEGEREGKTS